jgi:hypothetical protein
MSTKEDRRRRTRHKGKILSGRNNDHRKKINLDEPSWSLLGCRTSAKVTGKNIIHKR